MSKVVLISPSVYPYPEIFRANLYEALVVWRSYNIKVEEMIADEI